MSDDFWTFLSAKFCDPWDKVLDDSLGHFVPGNVTILGIKCRVILETFRSVKFRDPWDEVSYNLEKRHFILGKRYFPKRKPGYNNSRIVVAVIRADCENYGELWSRKRKHSRCCL